MIYIIEENIKPLIDHCIEKSCAKFIICNSKESVYNIASKYEINITTDHFLNNKDYDLPNFESVNHKIPVISIENDEYEGLFGRVGYVYKGHNLNSGNIYYKID